jgi:hypothetical protein
MTFPGFSQQNSARENLLSFVQNSRIIEHLYPQEKAYLHFDNTGYFLGETIWFKAYVVTAGQHQFTNLSRILYVELLSPDGEVKDSRKLKIVDGQCFGEFVLPQNISPGYYEVRAYTRFMLNFGDDCVFSRVFPVYRQEEMDDINEKTGAEIDKLSPFIDKLRKPQVVKKDKLNVAFFPEGGNLIQGLTTNIAFKVTDETGRSVDVEGQTLHRGMGVFTCTPSKKAQTFVLVKNEKKYKFKLPISLYSGYTLNILQQKPQTLSLRLQRTPGIAPDSLGLAVTCRGQIYSFQTLYFQEQKNDFSLDISQLPSGVNRLTLFDKRGEILSDRPFFVHRKKDKGSITISSDKKNHQSFEQVNLNFRLADPSGKPQETCFSLSVRDADREMKTGYNDNIYTHLLLSSELKGYIEDPAYYFESDAQQYLQALDLLMMTQGWRRYSWEQTIGLETLDAQHYIEKEILVKGRVMPARKVVDIDGMDVTLNIYMTDSLMLTGTYPATQTGEFAFPIEDFEGKRFVEIITEKNQQMLNTKTMLDRQFSPVAKTYTAEETTPPEKIPHLFSDPSDSAIRTLEGMNHLSEVSIVGKRIKRDITYNVEREFNYLMDNGLRLPYSDIVTEYMKYRDKKFSGSQNKEGILAYKGTPGAGLYFVKRGIWQNINVQDILTIPLEEVEKIVVAFEGVQRQNLKTVVPKWDEEEIIGILVYPYDIPVRKQIGHRFTRIEGFSALKEFYSPNYKNNPPIPGETDYRRTLYWNPNVKTDKQGKASVQFYNNNSCKQMSIEAEGLTAEGVPIINKN